MGKSHLKPAPLPTRQEVLDFISDTPGKITKREIARAFGIKGPDKVHLKKMLRELSEEGVISRGAGRTVELASRLPRVLVAEFAGLNSDGEVQLRPSNWFSPESPPTILLSEKKRKGPAFGPSDRALVETHLLQDEPPIYSAKIIKRLPPQEDGILGVFQGSEKGGRVHPIDKKKRDDLFIHSDDQAGAVDGELVLVDLIGRGRRRSGMPTARVRKRLGDVSSPKSISLISIHSHDIPHVFPAAVEEAAAKATAPSISSRTDLRDLPLITIDPADARDHDDAICAIDDDSPDNKEGYHLTIAIADVAHYVRPNGIIDKEAQNRGNSCYFPDRVVPMLPEALSADLCSLMPEQDRAAMVVHIQIDKNGRKKSHKFERAIINSKANFTYNQVQRAMDGDVDPSVANFLEPIIKPLYGAFAALMKARSKRQPLDLDLPERRIELGDDGRVSSISLRERFDAHRIVEEFMIMANVAAAETLEAKKTPAMYRVHEEPPMDKLESLRDFLDSMGLSLTRGAVMKPSLFNGILDQVKDAPQEQMVNDVVLRSQTQAYYNGNNLGHFGLALPRYAHFTSPIRRYSDLLVHRGLISALGFGEDGLDDKTIKEFDTIADHISRTERRAMSAERECTDRYLAAYLSEHVGELFTGRISGVSRYGLFVTLEPSGGDGLIPISSLGDDYFRLDDSGHRLIGDHYGTIYGLGDAVKVRLLEANTYTGGMRLEMMKEDGSPITHTSKRGQRRQKGRRQRFQ